MAEWLKKTTKNNGAKRLGLEMPSLSVKHNDKGGSKIRQSTKAKYKERVLFLNSFTSFKYSIKSGLKNSTHS